MTVLVIDDDAELRDLLAACLRASGYRVVAAENGRDALTALAETPVDLIVTDIFMPEVDGLEVIRAVRSDRRALPILAISGNSGMAIDFLPIAQLMGADAVLAKPFEPDELSRQVYDLLPPS